MEFLVADKSWKCYKCDTATKSEFKWHLEIKVIDAYYRK